MKYPLEKYTYYQHTLPDGTIEIIAMSTYAGKYVKGIAKCHPLDNFDLEKGKKLAALRCNEKICAKRNAKSARDLAAVKKEAEVFNKKATNAICFNTDAQIALINAQQELDAYLRELKHE